MDKYEVIENGILNKDREVLRKAIGNLCYTSRDFSSGEFDEAIEYVESKGINLKDDFLVGVPTISSQKSVFTDEDFADAVFELKENFCDERIQDVKNIGKSLYAKKEASPSEVSRDSSNLEGQYPNCQSHQEKSRILMVIGLMAIIVIVLLVVLIVR